MLLYQVPLLPPKVVHSPIHICGKGANTSQDIFQLVTESGPAFRGRLRKSITLTRGKASEY
jgi:hypothetical protein